MKKSIGAKTLLYPTPVLIVGTYDKAGKPNVMAVAWGGMVAEFLASGTIARYSR